MEQGEKLVLEIAGKLGTEKGAEAWRPGKDGKWREGWTKYATDVVTRTFGTQSGWNAVSKASPDKDGREEYLTLDVTACIGHLGHPIAVCEIENEGYHKKIKYCLWKLLAVRAKHRLLIATFKKDDLSDLLDALREVASKFKDDNEVWVLLADFDGNAYVPQVHRFVGERHENRTRGTE